VSLNDLGDGQCSREPEEEMHMIRDAANPECRTVVIGQDCCEIGV
jgi:hypothetical protein